jgi:hypothetical protein
MQEPFVIVLFQEGETIRINVKNKSTAGSGMLSAAGLSGVFFLIWMYGQKKIC